MIKICNYKEKDVEIIKNTQDKINKAAASVCESQYILTWNLDVSQICVVTQNEGGVLVSIE